MYQNRIKFTPKDILEKNFKIDMRGYTPKEVDQFLDDVIGDYEQFLEIINGLEKEKADLLSEIMSLKQELRNTKLSMEVASKNVDGTQVTNVDIMRRLSQLEKMVYGQKNNEEENN
jgi:DivIVA domain-containing protein